MNIHPTAIVDPSAKLGDDVQIGPYSIIGSGVVLGARTKVFSHAVIEYTEMGEDCQVYPHAVIGLRPQHLGYKDEPTRVVIGSRCTIREGVSIHRGTMFDHGITKIGDDNYFMGNSHVAHDCVIGNNVILANGALVAGHVQLGDRCFVSAMAAFHQFVRVGAMAIVSGGAMVPTDVAPYAMVQGDRAKLIGLNLVGLKRGGVDRESMKLIKKCYRTVFYSGLTLTEALKQPELNADNKFIRELKDFLSVPRRGFVRPTNHADEEGGEETE